MGSNKNNYNNNNKTKTQKNVRCEWHYHCLLPGFICAQIKQQAKTFGEQNMSKTKLRQDKKIAAQVTLVCKTK